MIVLVTSKFTESSTKLKKSSNWQYFCAGFEKCSTQIFMGCYTLCKLIFRL